jgi:hypothetical protein
MTHQRHDEELRAEESHEENVRAIRLPARPAAVPRSPSTMAAAVQPFSPRCDRRRRSTA